MHTLALIPGLSHHTPPWESFVKSNTLALSSRTGATAVYRTVLAADLPPGIVDSLPDDAPYSILAALSQHGFEAIVIVPIENQCHVDLLADAPCDVQVQLFAGPRLGCLCRGLISHSAPRLSTGELRSARHTVGLLISNSRARAAIVSPLA